MKFTYRIDGMHCVACVDKIKTALSTHLKVVDVTLHPPQLIIEADKTPLISDLNNMIASAGHYHLHPAIHAQDTDVDTAASKLSAYYPIFLIAAYIIGVATLNNFYLQTSNWQGWMNQFMAGFFLVFSGFKLLDLSGFATGYATYDLLAKRWHAYGYIYPFLELGLGILYLTAWQLVITQVATIIIMGFSSLGVINSLLKKQQFQCACLGTVLKVPLSNVTLVEDLLMVVLALYGLIMFM